MTQPERQERNADIIRVYARFMQRQIPDHREAVFHLAAWFDLSESTVRKVVKEEQDKCEHDWFQPYEKYQPEVMVCEKCWKEKE